MMTLLQTDDSGSSSDESAKAANEESENRETQDAGIMGMPSPVRWQAMDPNPKVGHYVMVKSLILAIYPL